MPRLSRLAAIAGLLAAFAPAQDAIGADEELRELRKAVEQQTRQIEALSQQIAKLAAAIEGKAVAEPVPAPAKEEFSTATAAKAEPTQPHHIVVKGETLTSIAKLYNVPLAELLKANQGINERKIQIGQTILLPVPPPSPSEPKPNP